MKKLLLGLLLFGCGDYAYREVIFRGTNETVDMRTVSDIQRFSSDIFTTNMDELPVLDMKTYYQIAIQEYITWYPTEFRYQFCEDFYDFNVKEYCKSKFPRLGPFNIKMSTNTFLYKCLRGGEPKSYNLPLYFYCL